MTDPYLTRAEIDHLADQLAKLPGIEAELAVAVTGMRRGQQTRRSVPRSKPPYSIEMQCLIDELRNTLVGVVRDLCEQRGLGYDGGNSISGMGKWLTKNRVALQLVESGVESFNDLCTVITRCERSLSFATEPPLAASERDAARQAFVSVSTVETVARRVGEYGLTAKRLRMLDKKDACRPVTVAVDGTKLYRLGDVLDAHKDMPRRGNLTPRAAPS